MKHEVTSVYMRRILAGARQYTSGPFDTGRPFDKDKHSSFDTARPTDSEPMSTTLSAPVATKKEGHKYSEKEQRIIKCVRNHLEERIAFHEQKILLHQQAIYRVKIKQMTVDAK